jgi:transcription termination factor NusB
MSNRHLARTIAMQTLFLWDFNEQPQINTKEIVETSFSSFAPNMTDHSFTENIVNDKVTSESFIKAEGPFIPGKNGNMSTKRARNTINFTDDIIYSEEVSELESSQEQNLHSSNQLKL